jgi:hypothetical protein
MSTTQRLRNLPRRLRRRRVRLLGVGLGRTGTTSLAHTFSSYRTAHEAAPERFLPVATDVVAGRVRADAQSVRQELRHRSRRYGLEVDVAQYLTPVAGTLATMYDDARFVLLVRDCFSWLDSRIEKLAARIPGLVTPWGPWFDALFPTGVGFEPEETALARANLAPIASYLRAWSTVTEGVLRAVPAERLLVVRTEDLSASREPLAEFAGVPASTLTVTHTNQARIRQGILADVPREFVVARAREHCSALMERYWGPEWTDLAGRLPTSR